MPSLSLLPRPPPSPFPSLSPKHHTQYPFFPNLTLEKITHNQAKASAFLSGIIQHLCSTSLHREKKRAGNARIFHPNTTAEGSKLSRQEIYIVPLTLKESSDIVRPSEVKSRFAF
jgi:hypothetical protein